MFPSPAHTHSFYLTLGASVGAILCVAWLGQVLEAVEMSWGGWRAGETSDGGSTMPRDSIYQGRWGDRTRFAGELLLASWFLRTPHVGLWRTQI